MIWVRGTKQRPNITYPGTATFPSLTFFLFAAVRNDSYEGNWNNKNRKKPWERLLNNFQSWLGSREIENRPRMLAFSHALEFILVSVQENHFCEGELQGDCEITFLFLDQEQQHCGGFRQSPRKHLKETDHKKHNLHGFHLPTSLLPPLSGPGSVQKGIWVLWEMYSVAREQDQALIIQENGTLRRLSLPFLEAGIPSRTSTIALGRSPSLSS